MADRIVSVGISPAQLAELKDTLAGVTNGLPRALANAANRTVSTGRTRIVRRVRQIVNIKKSEADKFLTLGKATLANPTATIRISRKPIPLYDFTAKQSKLGVYVKVRVGGGRELIRGAFIAQMKSGHIGVFKRRKGKGRRVPIFRGGKRVNTSQLPIYELKGPTVLGTFEGTPGLAEEELKNLGDVLQKNIASQVNYLLNRRKGDAPDGERD